MTHRSSGDGYPQVGVAALPARHHDISSSSQENAVDFVTELENPLPLVTLQNHELLLESREPWRDQGNNFVKCAKWSPDGKIVLAIHDDTCFRLYWMPSQFSDTFQTDEANMETMQIYTNGQEGGPIYDACFFPGFTCDCPATCCFITTSLNHPVHLREAATGALCATYRPFNNVEEVCHAYSLCFSPDGTRILAGFSRYIRMFDIQRPGRQIEDWVLSTRRGKGQKGIIGALTGSSYSRGIYAAGSYNRSVCIYHEGNRGERIAMFKDTGRGHDMGGTTHLEWANEWMLLSGHRHDQWIRVWDSRMAGGEYRQHANGHSPGLLHRFPRSTQTQQRFLFSVKGDLVATGDDGGTILFYSLCSFTEVGRIESAHNRPCVAAMLHPNLDAVLSASGARHFPNYDVESPVLSPCSSPPVKRNAPFADKDQSACVKSEVSEWRSDGFGTQSCTPMDNSLRVWRVAFQ